MQCREYFKVTVRWGVKANSSKNDTKVISAHQDRLSVRGVNAKQKLERVIKFLEIISATSDQDGNVSLQLQPPLSAPAGELEDLTFSCTLASDALRLLAHIVCSIEIHFPQAASQLNERLPMKVTTPGGNQQLRRAVTQYRGALELAHIGDKCGSFGVSYEYFCSFAGVEPKEEIRWDVETIYFAQANTEFSLNDFSHFSQSDLASVIGCLAFNNFFTALKANAIKFSPVMIRALEFTLTHNHDLVEISFSDCGLKGDFARSFARSISNNNNCNLRRIFLQGNSFGDEKSTEFLKQPLTKLSDIIEQLDISNCGLNSKMINKIAESLMPLNSISTLTYLALDGNDCRADTPVSLLQLLSKLGNLTVFSCEGCSISIESLTPALIRSAAGSISELRLSRNPFFSNRKSSKNKELPSPPAEWKLLFSISTRLRRLHLNGCRLPHQALAELVHGLAANTTIKDLELQLAENEFGVAGAQVLVSCFREAAINCISSIELDDNCLDSEVNEVVEAISKAGIQHLSIGGNNFLAKEMAVIEEFSELITTDSCPIRSLSLRNAKLKSRTAILLNAVGQCSSLQQLDIGGNCMGSLGAKILAKSLCLNTSISHVDLDANGIGLAGIVDIADSLSCNSTLRSLPPPVTDAAQAIADGANPRELRRQLRRIQDALAANASALERTSSRDYRLQAELTSSGASISNFVSKMEASLRALPPSGRGEDSAAGCVRDSRAAMRDAEAARFLLDGLSGISDSFGKAHASQGEVAECLGEELVARLSEAAEADLHEVQEAMIQHLAEQCSWAFTQTPLLNDKLHQLLSEEKCCVSKQRVEAVLKRTLAVAMREFIASLKFNSALHLNTHMQHQILQNLSLSEIQLSKLVRENLTKGKIMKSESVDGSSMQPPSQHQQRNQRPLSLFSNKPGKGKSQDHMQLVDIDIDADSDVFNSEAAGQGEEAEDGEGRQVVAKPAPLPRRPRGPQGKRLPTQTARQQQQQQDQEQQEPKPRKASFDSGGAWRPPAGAVPLMFGGSLGPPPTPPPKEQRRNNSEEDNNGDNGDNGSEKRSPTTRSGPPLPRKPIGGVAVMMQTIGSSAAAAAHWKQKIKPKPRQQQQEEEDEEEGEQQQKQKRRTRLSSPASSSGD